MSALLLPALVAGSSGQGALYVDDVFSTYLRTGTGADTTVTTGIDMTKGYMLWSKGRSGATEHAVYDSARGVTLDLVTNSTAAQTTQATGLKAVSSTGHTIGSLAKMNTSGATYVDWVFRKAPKFFDVVTYTGDGAVGRQIAHSLGVAPGMIIVKRTDSASNWYVWHNTNRTGFALNLTQESIGSTGAGIHSSTHFNVAGLFLSTTTPDNPNINGATYVAYLFAHDLSAEGIIQCGSFTTDASGNATVNSGWANGSQFAMIKAASTTGDWEMYDTARTSAWSGNDARLRANLSNAEDSVARISASGTSITFAGLSANSTYIYMAIRSPS